MTAVITGKLTFSALQTELVRRLASYITTTTATDCLNRAVRTLDSMASYTFLQKTQAVSTTAQTFTLTTDDINLGKEVRAYVAVTSQPQLALQYVPYSEINMMQKSLPQGWALPMAFAFVGYSTNLPQFSMDRSYTGTINVFYQKRMTYPSNDGSENYCEIPANYYDLILDVAEAQQKDLYRIADSESAMARAVERSKQFVMEYNSSGGVVRNINDEMIRGAK